MFTLLCHRRPPAGPWTDDSLGRGQAFQHWLGHPGPGGTWEPSSQSVGWDVTVRLDGSLQSMASVSVSRKREAHVMRTSEKFL